MVLRQRSLPPVELALKLRPASVRTGLKLHYALSIIKKLPSPRLV
jgi:hypothetical protein